MLHNNRAYSTNCILYTSVLCIDQFTGLFPARIDDGEEEDDWHFQDFTTKTDLPLRADSWFKQSDEALSSRDFAGIHINIWNREKISLFLVHSLSGGGSHNLGYHAMQEIQHHTGSHLSLLHSPDWTYKTWGCNAHFFMAIRTQDIAAIQLTGRDVHPAARHL
jgi:hypothetical protein